MNFLIMWTISYCLFMCAMCNDNIIWLPADRKWFTGKTLQPHFFIWIVRGKEYIFPKDKFALKFLWKERITHVLKHPYDIIPGLIWSFIFTIFWRFL